MPLLSKNNFLQDTDPNVFRNIPCKIFRDPQFSFPTSRRQQLSCFLPGAYFFPYFESFLVLSSYEKGDLALGKFSSLYSV